jgi:hypothetical protein
LNRRRGSGTGKAKVAGGGGVVDRLRGERGRRVEGGGASRGGGEGEGGGKLRVESLLLLLTRLSVRVRVRELMVLVKEVRRVSSNAGGEGSDWLLKRRCRR